VLISGSNGCISPHSLQINWSLSVLCTMFVLAQSGHSLMFSILVFGFGSSYLILLFHFMATICLSTVSLPFQSSASFRTWSRCSTGMISTVSSFDLSTMMSCRFAFGTMILFIPVSIAASTFADTPPTGRTSPLTDKLPVIAVSCLTGTSFSALMIAIATAMLALSPSTPSYVCKNCT